MSGKNKAAQLRVVTEILLMEFYAQSYKDPKDPKRLNPALEQEIEGIIDGIFSEEMDQIREVANHEREILKRDFEIARLQGTLELERTFNEQMSKMERRIRAIFAEMEQETHPLRVAVREAREMLAELEAEQAEAKRKAQKELERRCRGRDRSIVLNIVERFMNRGL